MPAITKTLLLSEIREMADATDSDRWGDATVLRLADTVFQREWKDILDACNVYRWHKITVTTTADGRITLSDLTTAATHRFHRILGIRAGQVRYSPMQGSIQPLESPDTTNSQSGTPCWWRLGDEIQLFPVAASASVDVYINSLPPSITNLASGDTVTFPEDYEILLVLGTAALMLSKGGAEVDAGRALSQVANELRGDLLAKISRTSTDPLVMGYSDDAFIWGGQ